LLPDRWPSIACIAYDNRSVFRVPPPPGYLCGVQLAARGALRRLRLLRQGYTVCKPVYETCTKNIPYTVCKPVYETCEKVCQYTTCEPVYETCTKNFPYTVCKPVYETCLKQVPSTVCKPVCYTKTINCTKLVPTCVPYTVTRCVPVVVCKQVPVTVCCPVPTCCGESSCETGCCN